MRAACSTLLQHVRLRTGKLCQLVWANRSAATAQIRDRAAIIIIIISSSRVHNRREVR